MSNPSAETIHERQREQIGTCEICGATDHHLVEGACPACARKCAPLTAAGAERILRNLGAFVAETACPLPNPDRVYGDDDLEFWGEYFVRHDLRARGILFETFMNDPRAIAQAMILRQMNEPPARKHVRANSRPMFDADLIFLRKQAD